MIVRLSWALAIENDLVSTRTMMIVILILIANSRYGCGFARLSALVEPN